MKIRFAAISLICLALSFVSSCVTVYPSEWIPAAESIDREGLGLYESGYIYEFDGAEAALSVYVSADEGGEPIFDDGGEWLIVLETASGDYPLFPRSYVQLGDVSGSAFYGADGVFHVMVTVKQTAGLLIYDCVYDAEKQAFEARPVYEAGGINMLVY